MNHGMILELLDQKLEDSWFKSLSCGGFSKAFTRCSVKCMLGYKLFFDPILSSISLMILLAPFCVSVVSPNLVLRAIAS
jgi:hypothetical protein